MPSKGFQLYTFVGVSGCQVKYSVPNATLTRNEVDKFFSDHLEVDKKNISGPFNFVGKFSFDVTRNGALVTSQWLEVNTLTNWMGDLAPSGSAQAAKPFRKLILPAAHDIGMNSMQSCEAIMKNGPKPFLSALKGAEKIVGAIAEKMSDDILLGLLPNIIRGLAITQKDSLADILSIGARYFEFRPAHLYKAIIPFSGIQDRLYFEHGPIPGMSFEQFLHDCVVFLLQHPLEIVVVQLRWDGVPAECAQPGDTELAGYLSAALQASNGSLIAGNLDDMQRLTIEQLRSQRKRFILLKPTDALSTYTDAGNATLNGDSIIAEFNNLASSQQAGKAFTNLQCQATATNIKNVVIYSVMTANVSNSCLLATKPACDSKTLPWIRSNALGRLTSDELIVVMNDFIDGATAETAIGLSKVRLG